MAIRTATLCRSASLRLSRPADCCTRERNSSLFISAPFLGLSRGSDRLVALRAESSGGRDHGGQRRSYLVPSPGLQAAVRIDPEPIPGQDPPGLAEQSLDLLGARHPRGMDIVHPWPHVTRIRAAPQDVQDAHAGAGALDQEDIGV